MAEDFNTLVSVMGRAAGLKINKEREDLHSSTEHLAVTDMCRAPHPVTAHCTVFSGTYGSSSRINHMSGHKRSLNNFKKIEVIKSIFFQPQWNEARNPQQKSNWKIQKYMEINTVFKNQRVKEKNSQEKI